MTTLEFEAAMVPWPFHWAKPDLCPEEIFDHLG
jgi:hypothetical protein